MTGLLGGGHAIYYDAATGVTRNLDFFCAVPGLGTRVARSRARAARGAVRRRARALRGRPASCAVPGVPAGLGALSDAHGRLPWARLVEPALQLARTGVAMPAAHVACLRMLEPVMTLREGARIYAPGGRLLEAGEPLRPARARRCARGARGRGRSAPPTTGSIAAALLALSRERGGVVTADDLAAYEADVERPVRSPTRAAGS